jgi:hypothetical protein
MISTAICMIRRLYHNVELVQRDFTAISFNLAGKALAKTANIAQDHEKSLPGGTVAYVLPWSAVKRSSCTLTELLSRTSTDVFNETYGSSGE